MNAIQNVFINVKCGKEYVAENLVVTPLITRSVSEPGYLTLDEALKGKLAEVTEVSEGGDVPELYFENKSDTPVLLVDGEELIGAKQNRVLNLTILVAAFTKVVIPVSCVEQGRWSYRSKRFKTSNSQMYARGRAKKMEQVSFSLKESGVRESRQGEVWQDINCVSERLSVSSDTGAMADIYAEKRRTLKAYTTRYRNKKNQVGAVFTINGSIAGIEIFDSPHTYKKVAKKLLGSYALDALYRHGERPKPTRYRDVGEFIGEISKQKWRTYTAVGEGKDLRTTGQDIVGGALRVDERIVHLSAFQLEKEGGAY